MPNILLKRTYISIEKWRFFILAPILAPFLGQNPKIAISQERLDQFQKYLRSRVKTIKE